MSRRKGMIGMGLLLLFLGTFSLFRMIEAYRENWYWTNRDMRLSLAGGRDFAEIFVVNRPLEEILATGGLRVKIAGSERPLLTDDVTLRVNRLYELTLWDTVLTTFFLSSGLVAILCSFFVSPRLESQSP